MGESQSGNYLWRYYKWITPIAKLQNGAPIYDGYLIEDTGTGPSASAALDQCAANLPADDPQRVLRGRSEPLFIVNSEHLYPRVGRPADSNTPDSRLWLWMVAGASHGWTWQYDYGDAALEDLIKAGFADSGGWSHFECGPDQPEVDLYMVEKKAYEYLHRWVLRGTPPPAASDTPGGRWAVCPRLRRQRHRRSPDA